MTWTIMADFVCQSTADFAFLPFGGGPRKCVGDQFALMESTVALAMMLRRFDFQLRCGSFTICSIFSQNIMSIVYRCICCAVLGNFGKIAYFPLEIGYFPHPPRKIAYLPQTMGETSYFSQSTRKYAFSPPFRGR
jgi:hypothetical protein